MPAPILALIGCLASASLLAGQLIIPADPASAVGDPRCPVKGSPLLVNVGLPDQEPAPWASGAERWLLASRALAPQPGSPVRPGPAARGESGLQGLALSHNGALVAFASDADDLTPGDDNGCSDVFLYDVAGDTMRRLGSSLPGAAGPSLQPALSADGRMVAFTSRARDLLSDDPAAGERGPWPDVYVWDRDSDSIERVSSTGTGAEPRGGSSQAALSADGRLVVYTSSADDIVPGDDNRRSDVLLYDRRSDLTRLISATAAGASGNGHSLHPAISSDGRVIAFVSSASDLVDGDDNETTDIFVHDLVTGVTRRIDLSVRDRPFTGGPGRQPSLSLSRDGTVLAFLARAAPGMPASLVDERATPISRAFITELASGLTQLAGVDGNGSPLSASCFELSLSDDGRLLAFSSTMLAPGRDVLIFDRRSGRTRVLAAERGAARTGEQTLPRLAGDGSRLALVSTMRLGRAGEHDGGDVLIVPVIQPGDEPVTEPVTEVAAEAGAQVVTKAVSRSAAGFSREAQSRSSRTQRP